MEDNHEDVRAKLHKMVDKLSPGLTDRAYLFIKYLYIHRGPDKKEAVSGATNTRDGKAEQKVYKTILSTAILAVLKEKCNNES